MKFQDKLISFVISILGEISRQVKKQSDELMATSMLSVLSEESTDLDSSGGSSLPLDSSESWFADILNVDDLVEIDPNRGQFLVKLQVMVPYIFCKCQVETRSILIYLFCESMIY